MRRAALTCLLTTTLLAAVAPSPAIAEQRYIDDEIHITFREGPGPSFTIKRYHATGTELELLEPPEDAEEQYSEEALEEWSYVRNPSGEEGWVQKRFLVPDLPARERIGQVEAELTSAEERIGKLEEDLQAANEGYQLVQDNKKLKERLKHLLDRKEELEDRNRELGERNRQRWFIVGAGVLVTGLVLGLILPLLRPRRRSSWSGDL